MKIFFNILKDSKILQKWYLHLCFLLVGLFFLCTFVVQSSFGRNPQTIFFHDKELLVMSNIFRKVCYQFLELDCNSKAVTPPTIIFSMQSENPIVITGINDDTRVTQLQHYFVNSTKDLTRIDHFVECYFECLNYFDFKTDAFSYVSQIHFNRFGFYPYASFVEFRNKLV